MSKFFILVKNRIKNRALGNFKEMKLVLINSPGLTQFSVLSAPCLRSSLYSTSRQLRIHSDNRLSILGAAILFDSSSNLKLKMASRSNKGVILAEFPGSGSPPSSTFQVKDREIDIDNYELNINDILLRNLYLSVDPGTRSLMHPDIKLSHIEGFKLGEVLRGPGIAEVVKSNNEKYVVGDVVFSMIGWEEYTHITAKATGFVNVILSAAQRNELNEGPEFPLSYHLGAAAGAVGHILGQIAKINGLRVVGSAGDDAKVEYLIKELKFDAAFNYKKVDLDQYDAAEPYGIKNLNQVIRKRVKIQGFIVVDYYMELYKEFLDTVGKWLKEGQIKCREHVTIGVENAPQAFVGMMKGENYGKAIVKIADL
ncbi:17647_t:CDS:2 [Acaulospora colombiana]|uniref:17647_t:CDS:1 n=1 Tax=Acaulospora colombiana TaxID=27376 RepID=A0ACA9N0E1_9GLOM|nr:17647_t:CDS:2 [Acaulospora colombiana]